MPSDSDEAQPIDRRKFNRGTIGNRGGRPAKRRALVMDGIIQDGHWRVVSVNDETIVLKSTTPWENFMSNTPRMKALSVIANGDNCWPDLKQKGFIEGQWVAIARLPNGTVGGNATVTVRIELPDGSTVLALTTLALLGEAMDVFRAVGP